MINLWRAACFIGAALAFCPYYGTHEPRWIFVYLGALMGFLLWRRVTLPDICGLAIIGYAATSLLWSRDAAEGLTSLLPLIGLFGVFLLFEHGPPVKWMGSLAAIAAGAAVVFTNIYPDVNGGFFNPNWVTEFVVISGIVAVARGGKAGFVIAASAIIWTILYNSSYAWLAAIGSLIVMACVALRWWWSAVIITLLKINLLVFVVPHMGREIALSFTSRYELWINTLALWLKAPVFGLGLGSYNHEYWTVAESHLPYLGDYRFHDVFLYPGQAHNDALTTLAELGIVGIALCGLFCIAVLRVRSFNMTWARWPLSGAIGISMIAFPLFLPSSAFLVAALIGASSRSVFREPGLDLDFLRRFGSRFMRNGRSSARGIFSTASRSSLS